MLADNANQHITVTYLYSDACLKHENKSNRKEAFHMINSTFLSYHFI